MIVRLHNYSNQARVLEAARRAKNINFESSRIFFKSFYISTKCLSGKNIFILNIYAPLGHHSDLITKAFSESTELALSIAGRDFNCISHPRVDK